MAAEYMLINILKRAKFLAADGTALFCTPPVEKFLRFEPSRRDLENNKEWIRDFVLLDDYDIFASIKVWVNHPDSILSVLCRNLMDRHLYKVLVQNEPFHEGFICKIREKVVQSYGIDETEVSYFIVEDTVTNKAYSLKDDKIKIRFRDGSLMDVSEASDQLNISVLSASVTKYVLCYPKHLQS
jgi:hypothetical protein